MVECGIPGHITGLYIFAVVNLCALLNISLVSADVFVIDIKTNHTIAAMQDKQAMFGPDFPKEGLIGRVVYVTPDHDACGRVDPPPHNMDLPWIALISRGPCHFDKKVLDVQMANYSAAIVHNSQDLDSLVQMAGGEYADQIEIPSVFVGYTDGMSLAERYNYTRRTVLVKIEEFTDDNFTSYFWPFTVVVSICFLGVVIFSIIKCVRYFQHRQRTRLSLAALKKIPTRKYKKGDHYDTCAICLEDYEEGEKLRVLPCAHTYHCKCIDPWLTKRKKTCPQCKRRVIPGQETDSESEGEGEGEGATENTPLLGNNNTAHSITGPRARGHTSTFERSGLPATVQPEVVVIRDGRSSLGTAAVSNEEEEEDSDPELEGAVGGVGISDQQDFVGDTQDVIVEVEPAQQDSSHNTSEASSEPAAALSSTDESTPLTSDGRHSPARAEGSINAAYTSSGSSEDDGNTTTAGRGGKRKKTKSNHVV